MKRLFHVLLMFPLLAGCVAISVSPREHSSPRTASAAEAIVQTQVDAYNRRDLEAFLATYAEDAEAFTFPNTPIGAGKKSFRDIYGGLFRETPDLAVVISNRIVQGNFVIDEEQVNAGGKKVKATAIYQVEAGKIRRVWFLE